MNISIYNCLVIIMVIYEQVTSQFRLLFYPEALKSRLNPGEIDAHL